MDYGVENNERFSIIILKHDRDFLCIESKDTKNPIIEGSSFQKSEIKLFHKGDKEATIVCDFYRFKKATHPLLASKYLKDLADCRI